MLLAYLTWKWIICDLKENWQAGNARQAECLQGQQQEVRLTVAVSLSLMDNQPLKYSGPLGQIQPKAYFEKPVT